MTIQHAYEFAVDYESTEAEMKAKDFAKAESLDADEEAIFSAAGHVFEATVPHPREQGRGYLYDPANAGYYYASHYQ